MIFMQYNRVISGLQSWISRRDNKQVPSPQETSFLSKVKFRYLTVDSQKRYMSNTDWSEAYLL